MRFVLLCLLVYLQLVTGRYTRYWLVRITDRDRADSLARLSGLVNRGQVGELRNVFQFEYTQGEDRLYLNITDALQSLSEVEYALQEKSLNHVVRNFTLPTDPFWQYQWPWFNSGNSGGPPGYDLNVVPVWIEGVSGTGTTALVIDNGIQLDHPDLQENIDISLCYSTIHKSTDINPIDSLVDYNHGTSCAGEIAMAHDNGVCGTGVAYRATIGGFQVNFSDFLPSDEIAAFNHLNQDIQVYSNSWGPDDKGYTVGGPQRPTQDALYHGVTNGRNGLGSIYIFSSGNGGHYGDSCAADGYASNRFTIAVGSADQSGTQAFYDEDCSAKMAVTYSYNSVLSTKQVVTTFPNSECESSFTGTSASAPLLAGALLLALEVNPRLSWRDVQYLIVYTSKTSSLVGGTFVTNGAGLRVSSEFGFGAIDVESLVTRARYWTPVVTASELNIDILSANGLNGVFVTDSNPYFTTFTVPAAAGGTIRYLEHVILTTTFTIVTGNSFCYDEDSVKTNPFVVNQSGPRRGDASITLCSPRGTCSKLLPERPKDYVNCTGYNNWPFMSVQFWGEDPVGTWNVTMSFSSDSGGAALSFLSSTLFGVAIKPEDVVSSCNPACATPTGCSYGNGSQYCDACGSGYYRNVTTLECLRSCPYDACIIEGICVYYNGSCPQLRNGSNDKNSIIIIVSAVCAVTALVLLIVCLLVCLCCCCCHSSDKNYSRLSFRDDSIQDTAAYQPYVPPVIV